jgi:teichuronic acid biosynthesis glycosyltransferase TuaC
MNSTAEARLKILIVTAMYPHPGNEGFGAFVMQQVEQLQSLGHDVDGISFPGYQSKWEYLRAAVKVFRETRSHKYSVVHAHYGVTGLAALFRNSTPLVITVHGSDALVGWREPCITKVMSKLADATIVVNQKIFERIPGDIIPCGVNLSLFEPKPKAEARKRLDLSVDRKYVLFPFNPSRVVKRFDLATAAVQQLASEGLDVELLTVSQVHFTAMPWYYSAADAMILCSDSEGSPTSVKEALACNLPVVTVDVGDVKEILAGIDGVEIVDRSVDSLAAGLRRVLSRAEGFQFNSRQAIGRYSQQRTADSIIQVYRRITRRQNAASVQRLPEQAKL